MTYLSNRYIVIFVNLMETQKEGFRARFSQEVRDAFTLAGDREPIGSVLRFLASLAFERGMGRDEAARSIQADEIFGPGGLMEGPLHGCIKNEIDPAYGEKRGRRKLSPQRKKLARSDLLNFLEKMEPDDSVTIFFRDLVYGRTAAGSMITDQAFSTISKGNLLRWALGKKTTQAIKRRLGQFVSPVIVQEYQSYIKSKPEQYIANFLNDVFLLTIKGDPPQPSVQFRIGNLKELFRDLAGAIDFPTFWKILEGHTESSLEELRDAFDHAAGLKDFFDIELWRPSIEAVWKEVSREVRSGPDIAHVTRAVRKSVGQVGSKVNFIILPPSPTKATIEVQSPTGDVLGRALVKPSIGNIPVTEIRRFVRNLLMGKDSSLARTLRAQKIFLEKDGLEVEALTAQLASFRSSRSRRNSR